MMFSYHIPFAQLFREFFDLGALHWRNSTAARYALTTGKITHRLSPFDCYSRKQDFHQRDYHTLHREMASDRVLPTHASSLGQFAEWHGRPARESRARCACHDQADPLPRAGSGVNVWT